MPLPSVTASIELTTEKYWQELEALAMDGKIDMGLSNMLKALICSHLRDTNPPTANTELIKLAKEQLKDGIWLREVNEKTGAQYYLDIMVYVTNEDPSEGLRKVFKLIPKYPNGRLKYLDDL